MLKRFIFWDYPRASWQYDVMVGIILIFIMLPPRGWFRDQPRTPRVSSIAVLPTEHGSSVYWVEPELLADLSKEQQAQKLERPHRQCNASKTGDCYPRGAYRGFRRRNHGLHGLRQALSAALMVSQMNRHLFVRLVVLGIGCGTLAWAAPAGDADAVLERIDKAAGAFHSMSAKLRRVQHTAAVPNEDDVDSGTILLKRGRRRDMRMLIDLTDPDPKTVMFSDHTVEIYYPKMQTVDEFDVSKFKELLEQFFLLGFGTSRAELQASYNLRLVGPDTVGGQKTDLLELVPKSKEVLQHLVKLEMWVAETGYPIQQKFFLKGGDYQLATYSDVKINPDLPDSALKLKLPKNVKREYPQK